MLGAPGKIITFYSYKGGTGRSMALSNVAWVLASNGFDILLIDWDLEAPGLHRYLREFLVDPELRATPGLIDYAWDAVRAGLTPQQDSDSEAPEFPSLEDYVVGIDWNFRNGGSMSLLPAGRQDENYAQRVNTFDWDRFYERLGGGRLLQAERKKLRSQYHFILIDSRTGVSDTSSICTVQMPDQLVVLFTLNRQSIRGVSAVAASIRAQRGDTLPIFPVPTRIDQGESERADRAERDAQRRFVDFLQHVQPSGGPPNLRAQADYWASVRTLYSPFYAFEEVPAVFKDTPGRRGTILDATEQLAAWLTDRKVTQLVADDDEKIRDDVVRAYELLPGEDDSRKLHTELPVRNRWTWFIRLVRREIRPHLRQYGLALVVAISLLAVQWSVLNMHEQRRQQTIDAYDQAANRALLEMTAAVKTITAAKPASQAQIRSLSDTLTNIAASLSTIAQANGTPLEQFDDASRSGPDAPSTPTVAPPAGAPASNPAGTTAPAKK
jgi:CobQ/CobB/MinD/ParA nucleotide binding domain